MIEKEKVLETYTQSDANFRSIAGLTKPETWEERIGETVAILENHAGLTTRKWEARIEEAMGTPDFPLLFADVLERIMIMEYQDTPDPFIPITLRSTTLTINKTAKRFRSDQGDGILTQISEGAPYPEANTKEAQYEITTRKHGKIIRLLWEALVNDDLGFFDNLPGKLGRSARRTDAYKAATQFFEASGWHTSLVGVGSSGVGGQSSISAAVLTHANLTTAIAEHVSFTPVNQDDASPIMLRPKFLAVSPYLELTAKALVNSTALIPLAAGTANANIVTGDKNAIADYGLQVLVLDWAVSIVTTGTVAKTMWGLISDPKEVAAVEVSHLRGRENPEIWVKDSNARQLGGSQVPGTEGSFEDDSVSYRVRHCVGAAQRDPIAIWGSNGV